MPTIATSATPSKPRSVSSTSVGDTLKPPVMMSSLMRSTIVTKPSSSIVHDVAGAEPAVDEDLGGLLGLVPVAANTCGPAHDQLAGLAGLDVVRSGSRGRRRAPRCRAAAGRRCPAWRFGGDRVRHQHGRALAEAVALDEVAAGQRLPRLDDRLRQRHRARDRDLDALQRDALLLRGLASAARRSAARRAGRSAGAS